MCTQSCTAVFTLRPSLANKQYREAVSCMLSYSTGNPVQNNTQNIMQLSSGVGRQWHVCSLCVLGGSLTTENTHRLPKAGALVDEPQRRTTNINLPNIRSCSRFIATIWSNAHHGDGAAGLLHLLGCCVNSRHRECRTTVELMDHTKRTLVPCARKEQALRMLVATVMRWVRVGYPTLKTPREPIENE